MRDNAVNGITRIDGPAVQALHAAVSTHHDRPRSPEEAPPARHAALPDAAPVEPAQPPTDLAFEVDAEARRLVVQVVDRDSGEVVRSFPMVMPGGAASASAHGPARGALVDAKA